MMDHVIDNDLSIFNIDDIKNRVIPINHVHFAKTRIKIIHRVQVGHIKHTLKLLPYFIEETLRNGR